MSAPHAAPHPLRALVESGRHDAVAGLLHEDVEFRSPAVHTPYRGRAACLHLLGHVVEVFEDFRYVDQLTDGHRTGLVFRTSITTPEGRAVQAEGWDYLTHDADGLITEFAVMLRPLSGLIALAQRMGERLQADPVPEG